MVLSSGYVSLYCAVKSSVSLLIVSEAFVTDIAATTFRILFLLRFLVIGIYDCLSLKFLDSFITLLSSDSKIRSFSFEIYSKLITASCKYLMFCFSTCATLDGEVVDLCCVKFFLSRWLYLVLDENLTLSCLWNLVGEHLSACSV